VSLTDRKIQHSYEALRGQPRSWACPAVAGERIEMLVHEFSPCEGALCRCGADECHLYFATDVPGRAAPLMRMCARPRSAHPRETAPLADPTETHAKRMAEIAEEALRGLTAEERERRIAALEAVVARPLSCPPAEPLAGIVGKRSSDDGPGPAYLREVLGEEGLRASGLPVWTTCSQGHGWWQGGVLSTRECFRCVRAELREANVRAETLALIAEKAREEERAAIVEYLRMEADIQCGSSLVDVCADRIERGDHVSRIRGQQ
jgi:hypothetical protein